MATEPLSPLGGTNVFDLWSEAVEDTFRVFVAECGDDPQAVLFVTDANGLFGLAVDTVRLMQIPGLVPPMLIVGVGYPDAATLIDTVDVRARDLTPTRSQMFAQSGGADRFISFLQEELWPKLRPGYPRAMANSIYFGHSLGGLFGAYAMLTQTATFDRYILSSPSLWWDNRFIFSLETSRTDQLNTSAVIGIGSLETDEGRRAEAANLSRGHPAKPPETPLDMVDDAYNFATQVEQREGLDLRYFEIADEYHATVPPVVLNRALRLFFADHTSASDRT